MSKETKNSVAALVAQLKLLVEKRDAIHSLKRRVKSFQRLDTRINNVVAKLNLAKEEEAKNPEDQKAKANVDNLEKSLESLKEKLVTRDAKIAEFKAELFQLRTVALCIEKNSTLEFIKLVGLNRISKHNAQEVMPLVWQTGLNIGNIKKRRWARPRRK